MASAAEPPIGAKSRIEFTPDGKLKLPTDYREWMYVGASVTPNNLNGGKAFLPEVHSIYMAPERYSKCLKTGEYHDGTVFVKELVAVGATVAAG